MPSTHTTNLGIEKIATGEQDGTWGTSTNTSWDLVDEAISGGVSITLASAGTSGSPNALPITNGASSNGRNAYIEITDGGDLGADVFAQLSPSDAEKVAYIRNSLSGSQDLYLFQGTYNASRDYVLAAGLTAVVKFSGGGDSAATAEQVLSIGDITAVTASSPLASSGGTTPDITHLSTAGNKHIPTGGSVGEHLQNSASGTGVWAAFSLVTWNKAISVEFPSSAEDITWFFTNKAITATEIRTVLKGSSTPSVTWTLKYGADRTSSESTIHSATVTSTTTGSDITSITDATIPADRYVWLETSAQSGTVTELHLTMAGTEDV